MISGVFSTASFSAVGASLTSRSHSFRSCSPEFDELWKTEFAPEFFSLALHHK